MARTVEVEGVRPRGRPTLRYIKKNGLTDVNVVEDKDWRMAVSKANTGVEDAWWTVQIVSKWTR